MTAAFFRLTLFGLCAFVGLACSGQGGASPTVPVNEGETASTSPRMPGTVALGSSQMVGEASLLPAAMWDVVIDVESLSASVGKRSDERLGQTFAETYLMEVTRYFTPSVMEIEGVTRTAPDRIKVDYTIAHPLAAATNPDAPASATNRADLGITGIVMFPLDATEDDPVTYFAETERPIIANTDAIASADGYYVPAGLVYGLGMQANCFPFRRLVNDARRESRVEVPLANLGVGNFDPNFGWQRSNWGPSHTGWTGYGALHQGQAARNSVELNLPADPITSISLPVMLIAKYLDPVGPGASPAERSANRLPTADADRTKFLYRMPQGAWDLEKVSIETSVSMSPATQTGEFRFHVTDWDAKAVRTLKPDLRDELAADKVWVGEDGLPAMQISVPDYPWLSALSLSVRPGEQLLHDDDSGWGGDTTADTGGAHDPLGFVFAIQEQSPSPRVARVMPGMLRVVDPTDSLTNHDIPLSPWLAPLGADARPVSATYQTFSFLSGDVQTSLTAEMQNPTVDSGGLPAVQLVFDAGDPFVPASYQIDWNGDGAFDGSEDTAGQMGPGSREVVAETPVLNPGLAPQQRPINVRWWVQIEALAEVIPLQVTVLANHKPVCQPNPLNVFNAQRLPSPAQFSWVASGTTSDPEGDAVMFEATNSKTSDVVSSATLPMPLTSQPIVTSENELVSFQLYLTDAANPRGPETLVWEQSLRIDGAPLAGWYKSMPLYEPDFAVLRPTAALDAAGNIYATGIQDGNFNFGNGNSSFSGTYIVSYTPQGTFRWLWQKQMNEWVSINAIRDLVLTDSGQIVAACYQDQVVDLGGGPRDPKGLMLFALESSSGAYAWDRQMTAYRLNLAPHLASFSNGDLLIGGMLWDGTANFGGATHTLTGVRTPFVVRTDPTGNYRWDLLPTGEGDSWIAAMGLDRDGTAYLGGKHLGTNDFGFGPETSTADWPLMWAINESGTSRWVKRLPGTNFQNLNYFTAIAGLQHRAGCMTGGWLTDPIDVGSGVAEEGSFWVTYDGDGNWLNEQRHRGYAEHIYPLPNGDALIGGTFRSSDLLPGSSPPQAAPALGLFLVRTGEDFTVQWLSRMTTRNCTSMALQDARIVMSGYYTSIADIDPGPGQFYMAPSGNDARQFINVLDAETGHW